MHRQPRTKTRTGVKPQINPVITSTNAPKRQLSKKPTKIPPSHSPIGVIMAPSLGPAPPVTQSYRSLITGPTEARLKVSSNGKLAEDQPAPSSSSSTPHPRNLKLASRKPIKHTKSTAVRTAGSFSATIAPFANTQRKAPSGASTFHSNSVLTSGPDPGQSLEVRFWPTDSNLQSSRLKRGRMKSTLPGFEAEVSARFSAATTTNATPISNPADIVSFLAAAQRISGLASNRDRSATKMQSKRAQSASFAQPLSIFTTGHNTGRITPSNFSATQKRHYASKPGSKSSGRGVKGTGRAMAMGSRSRASTQRSKTTTRNSATKAFRASRSLLSKTSPPLDRAALSRGEHVEILTFSETLRKLTPYLWPKGNISTKIRVVSALTCLVVSKLLNVAVPVLFKEAIDGLTIKVPSLQTPKSIRLAQESEAAAVAAQVGSQEGHRDELPTLESIAKTKKLSPSLDASQADATTAAPAANAIAGEPVEHLEALAEEVDAAIKSGAANDPVTQTRLIDSFTDFLQSPEFLNISTTQLPFAVLVAWGLVRTLGSLTNELKNTLFTRISNIARTSIATDLLRHLMNMDPAFHLDRNTGSISRAIDRGNKSIGQALSMITFRGIPTALEMALVVGVLATTCGPDFSSIAIATLVSYIAFTVVVTQWRTKFKQRMNKASNTASAVAFDALINVEAVQRFNNEELETAKYKEAWENYGTHQVKNEASLAFLNWGQSAIFSVGLTAVMLLAAKGVMDGSLTVGDLVLANALLLQLSVPLNIVGTVYRELKQSVLDMQTMFALRQTKSQITNIENPVDFGPRLARLQQINTRQAKRDLGLDHDSSEPDVEADVNNAVNTKVQSAGPALKASPTTPAPTPSLNTDTPETTTVTATNTEPEAEPHLDRTGGFSLELQDVVFQYPNATTGEPDQKNLLEGISVKIPAGTSIAFVGGSGSGKSTVLKLAARIFDADKGQILVDSTPIKNIELASLRRAIGIVPQDTILFNDTVMANIRYARPEATDEEVVNAAKLAQIHDAILAMKDGYQTLVGERGLKISGGQKQRVSIARLMLLNPPVVMCDEATSALDSRTEFEIMQNLRNLTRESRKTCVYVAHRLSTITHCDQIAVIEDGRIVELGTHHQLLGGQGKRYAAMWALQSTVDHLDDVKAAVAGVDAKAANDAATVAAGGSKAADEKL